MAHATRSHSAKLQDGGTGDRKRKVRADFKRDFFLDRKAMFESKAAALKTRFSSASSKIGPAPGRRGRNCAQIFRAMRETARLLAGLRSIALRVALMRAVEYAGQSCFGKPAGQFCQMPVLPKACCR